MKNDLQLWLELIQKPPLTPGVETNDLNKRLALMTVHVVNDAKKNPAFKEFQALLQ